MRDHHGGAVERLVPSASRSQAWQTSECSSQLARPARAVRAGWRRSSSGSSWRRARPFRASSAAAPGRPSGLRPSASKSAPQRRADEAHAAEHTGLAFQPVDAQPLAGFAQPGMGASKSSVSYSWLPGTYSTGVGQPWRGRKARQPEIARRPAASRAGTSRCRPPAPADRRPAPARLGMGMDFEVQVGQQLDLHRRTV